jgi:hypothetical protein
MPNYDAGHYFLTMLAPVKLGMSTVEGGKPGFSYRQTVLDKLASMKNSETSVRSRETPDESPFARNTMTHLARFVLINAPPYNGRESGDTLLSKVFSSGKSVLVRCFSIGDPDKPQTADSLGVPYLLFAADFDAQNGEDASLRKFTDTLWATMADELKPIFGQCYGFETVTDAAGFFDYVRKCQVETTMRRRPEPSLAADRDRRARLLADLSRLLALPARRHGRAPLHQLGGALGPGGDHRPGRRGRPRHLVAVPEDHEGRRAGLSARRDPAGRPEINLSAASLPRLRRGQPG